MCTKHLPDLNDLLDIIKTFHGQPGAACDFKAGLHNCKSQAEFPFKYAAQK